MKRHALFVGVNSYDDDSICKLRYSIPDASVLADRFKGLGYSTRLLTDPTGSELITSVEESTKGLESGDVFLFFFAGHGFTSQDGAHLLFCREHRQRLLRTNSAGIRVDAIEVLTSDGGFHRAFLLDSCRTDCFANVECRGSGTTRDLDFVSVPKCTKETGSYYLLRSCDKFRPSLEFDAIGHGLFTQGLLDAMDARDNRLAYCDTSFAAAVRGKMEDIQRNYNVSDFQHPSIGEVSGPAFSLFGSDYLDSSKAPALSSSLLSSTYVICPECGKHNLITDTFRCKVCGRDHLCFSHFSQKYNSCDECEMSAISIRQDEVQAIFEKGEDYYFGRNGISQDYIKAEQWYRKAAVQGCAEAQCRLGEILEKGTGNGLIEDLDEAEKWYRESAEQGYAKAQFCLGRIAEDNRGIPGSPMECDCDNEEYGPYLRAVHWYRKAAEQGLVDAQFRLGMMCMLGLGCKINEEEALKWFRRAAEQGLVDAQCELGECYEDGVGGDVDSVEAAKWYRKAAEQGDARAQYNLGVMYADGQGVTKDYAEAMRWYRKAAEQGHENAKKLLEREWMPYARSTAEGDYVEVELNEESCLPYCRRTEGANRGRYLGPIQNGKPHGTGRFVSSSGDVYTGEFFYGVRSGKGKIEYKNGAIYEGGWYFGVWSGEGTYTWPDGTRHIGCFHNVIFHGKGRQINPDGTSITGNWEDGKFITT